MRPDLAPFFSQRLALSAGEADAIAGLLQQDAAARRQMVREFGRIAGYVETMVGPLQHHLDGRKLAGVKRRLEQLAGGVAAHAKGEAFDATGVEHIVAAEGYFRALADGLRA